MPKSGKKKNKKNIDLAQADVTVGDFADSSQAKGRVKKPVLNYLVREAKQVCNKPEGTWEEKDVDDIPESWEDSEEDIMNGHLRRNRRSKRRDLTRDNPEVCYPIEIWFLLAKYIRPEDVKTFASICRSTYCVVLSRCFWIRMYRRYHKPTIQLPLYLQPQCIISSEFLRVAVVRALYHMYPPFLERKIKPSTILPKETNKLKRSRCVAIWHLQEGGKWHFYFKFAMPNSDARQYSSNKQTVKSCDKIKVIAKNPEEDCCIVCVTAPHFRYFPPTVMGSHLVDIGTTMGQDYRNYKIQMVFGSACSRRATPNYSNMGNSDYGGILDIDPVESVTILHWWNREYPLDLKLL